MRQLRRSTQGGMDEWDARYVSDARLDDGCSTPEALGRTPLAEGDDLQARQLGLGGTTVGSSVPTEGGETLNVIKKV